MIAVGKEALPHHRNIHFIHIVGSKTIRKKIGYAGAARIHPRRDRPIADVIGELQTNDVVSNGLSRMAVHLPHQLGQLTRYNWNLNEIGNGVNPVSRNDDWKWGYHAGWTRVAERQNISPSTCANASLINVQRVPRSKR